MDKEAVVHIYDGTLLSHKKEPIWVSFNEVDEPRAYYTEWSKSEREKQMKQLTINNQNIQAAHTTQYQENKQSSQNVGKKPKQIFLQRRHTDG